MKCDSERLELALVNGLECERLLHEIETENLTAVAWCLIADDHGPADTACTVCGSHNDVRWAIIGVSAFCEDCRELQRAAFED